MLIQMFVRPDSVVSRICFPIAPKRLLQQYLPRANISVTLGVHGSALVLIGVAFISLSLRK
jgi:hypothetical protein